MKLRFAAIVLVAAFCSATPGQAAAPSQPTAAMMKPVNAGVWTFVLQRHGGIWLIRASTWGTSVPA